MAERAPSSYRKGETVVKYRGRGYRTPPPAPQPKMSMASASELDELMASAEGIIAADEAERAWQEQQADAAAYREAQWDAGANIALDRYERERRERMLYNALHDPTSPVPRGTAAATALVAESIVPLQQQAMMQSRGSKSMVMELLKVNYGKTAGTAGVGTYLIPVRPSQSCRCCCC